MEEPQTFVRHGIVDLAKPTIATEALRKRYSSLDPGPVEILAFYQGKLVPATPEIIQKAIDAWHAHLAVQEVNKIINSE